ncbi:hypothetical protein A2866_02630 [Candidatus Roizmanbacteria bacterium RIFCSPHIGHO2_01_FULL_39_8]|uniref:Uncharacterized protein n=2 Tax=Candidatus Roizmaniibacteriota TaxID=1752723 RepID=A0A1F7GPQ9_9BACT|nr:MAG: hypothetical protein A2866_02630 [Candidatus Roizmanbacteria bacterium RIFCSPHIGHO2_01_FULL_39_8]OGK26924.1 MAG: hypothetical protein A3C28_06230 [Candidatus Roizmanbacteria bacterium RIFCSPHIGHO2_02_FULL_39_9]
MLQAILDKIIRPVYAVCECKLDAATQTFKWAQTLAAPGDPATCAAIGQAVGNACADPSTVVRVNTGPVTAGGLGFVIPTMSTFLTFAVRGFFVLAGLLALMFLLLGAMAWVTSGGNKESVDKARDKITAAILGIIIIVAVLSIIVVFEQIIFKKAVCFGISCPLTLPNLL